MKEDQESVGHRHARLEDTFLREIRTLLRDDVTDPAFEGLTVVSVDLSADGRNLRVHLACDEPDAPTPARKGELDRLARFVRHRLAVDLDLKRTPEVRMVMHR